MRKRRKKRRRIVADLCTAQALQLRVLKKTSCSCIFARKKIALISQKMNELEDSRLLWLGLAVSGKEKNYTILFSQYVKGKDSEDFDETARQIFGSAAWTTVIKEDRRKLQLTAGGGCHFCLELDDYGRCYLAATSKAYPTRYIFGTSTGDSTDRLFSCLRREVSNVDEWEEEMFPAGSIQGSRLKTSAKKFIKTYAAKFDDILSIDKVALVKRKVEDVKVTMGKNLDLALGERDALLEGLVEKSKKLETDAKLFSSNANAARRAACIRLYKSYVLIFLFVFLIILVIVLILNYSVFYWW